MKRNSECKSSSLSVNPNIWQKEGEIRCKQSSALCARMNCHLLRGRRGVDCYFIRGELPQQRRVRKEGTDLRTVFATLTLLCAPPQPLHTPSPCGGRPSGKQFADLAEPYSLLARTTSADDPVPPRLHLLHIIQPQPVPLHSILMRHNGSVSKWSHTTRELSDTRFRILISIWSSNILLKSP